VAVGGADGIIGVAREFFPGVWPSAERPAGGPGAVIGAAGPAAGRKDVHPHSSE
jgi:hypothetical protein